MNPQSIAQWIIDNPGSIHALAEEIAVLDYKKARSLGWGCEEMSARYNPEMGYGEKLIQQD